MKSHKTILFCILVLFQTASTHAAVPVALANQIHLTKGMFEDSATSMYRVQLMVAASNLRLDNADVAAIFQADARVILTVDSIAAFDHIHDVIKEIEASKWTPLKEQNINSASYYWRIVGAWEYTVLSLAINVDDMTIYSGGTWYLVDPGIAKRAIEGFVALAMGKLLRTEGATVRERK